MSVKEYQNLATLLTVMGVPDIACEAAMKAEQEVQTYHTITITDSSYTIARKSRMSNGAQTYHFGQERTHEMKSGRKHRTIVRLTMSPGPRIVETTQLKEGHTFVVTRTLVEDGDVMACTQVLKTPTKTVVTRRYFVRSEAVAEEHDDPCSFLKDTP